MQEKGERNPSLRLQGRSLSARDSREDTYYSIPQSGLMTPPYGLQTAGSMSLRPESNLKLNAPRILPTTPQSSSLQDHKQGARSLQHLSPTREKRSPSPQTGLSRSSSSARRLPAVPSSEAYLMPLEQGKDMLTSKRRLFSHKLNGQWRSMGQNDSQMNANSSNSHPEAINPSTASVSFDLGRTETTGNKTPSPRRGMSPQAFGRSAKTRASVTTRTDSTTSESGTLATSNLLGVEGKVHESLSLNNLTKEAASVADNLIRRGQNSRKSAKMPKKRSPARNSSRTNSSLIVNSSNSKPSRDSLSSKNTSSIKKTPGISSASQQIITYCMDNAKGDIAGRVVARMAHKRDDFAGFCTNLSPENWLAFLNQFREYLMEVVKNVQKVDKIKEASMKFGCNQVPRRVLGFKADFFSIMADALITECVFLDGAAHQPTEAIEAWSELVSGHMFSNIRDGYYQQIRFLRRNTQCFSSMFSHSSDQSTEGADVPNTPATCSTANKNSNNPSCISVPINK